MSESPVVYRSESRRANRQHICCECRGKIFRGETYHHFTGLWDGRWDTYKTCLVCDGLRNEINSTIKDYENLVPLSGLLDYIFDGKDHKMMRIFVDNMNCHDTIVPDWMLDKITSKHHKCLLEISTMLNNRVSA